MVSVMLSHWIPSGVERIPIIEILAPGGTGFTDTTSNAAAAAPVPWLASPAAAVT
jgi:hypothetical protein